MTIKVNFRYTKEVQSFLNKWFIIRGIIFFLFIFLVGYTSSNFVTTATILGLILLIYLGFAIKTILIIKEKNYYKKNGIKCSGIIKNIKVKKGHSGLTATKDSKYELVYLVVEYFNPYTNQVTVFTTNSVNGSPFTYLSSLEVTVYALTDGRAYATDFKKIKKLKDAVKYQKDYIKQEPIRIKK